MSIVERLVGCPKIDLYIETIRKAWIRTTTNHYPRVPARSASVSISRSSHRIIRSQRTIDRLETIQSAAIVEKSRTETHTFTRER